MPIIKNVTRHFRIAWRVAFLVVFLSFLTIDYSHLLLKNKELEKWTVLKHRAEESAPFRTVDWWEAYDQIASIQIKQNIVGRVWSWSLLWPSFVADKMSKNQTINSFKKESLRYEVKIARAKARLRILEARAASFSDESANMNAKIAVSKWRELRRLSIDNTSTFNLFSMPKNHFLALIIWLAILSFMGRFLLNNWMFTRDRVLWPFSLGLVIRLIVAMAILQGVFSVLSIPILLKVIESPINDYIVYPMILFVSMIGLLDYVFYIAKRTQKD